MRSRTLRGHLIRVAYARPHFRKHYLSILIPERRKEAAAHRLAAMSDAEFWKIVEMLKWGRPKTDYRRMQKQLMRMWRPEDAKAFRTTMDKLYGALDKAFSKWENEERKRVELGDDGYSDLLHHIIGLGKREYDKVMKDPSLAYDRGQKLKFTESFSYAIPHETDWQRLDVAKYVRWAEEQEEEYRAAAKSPYGKEMAKDIKTIVDALSAYAKSKNVMDFLKTEPAVTKALGRVRKGIDKARAEFQKAFDPLEEISNEWAVLNLYSDMKQFLTPP